MITTCFLDDNVDIFQVIIVIAQAESHFTNNFAIIY